MKIVYNSLLGGWYVVRGKHQTPLSGRFETKQDAELYLRVDTEEGREYLHRGISGKKFTRTFRLSEHVVVDGADFVNGLLVIDLKVVIPEEKRPRTIPIGK